MFNNNILFIFKWPHYGQSSTKQLRVPTDISGQAVKYGTGIEELCQVLLAKLKIRWPSHKLLKNYYNLLLTLNL